MMHLRIPAAMTLSVAACSYAPGSTELRSIATSDLASPPGYSLAVMARGNMLFTSGQVAIDGQGNFVGAGDMRAQTERVFANIKTILTASNTDFGHVTKLTVFMTDLSSENLLIFRRVRDQFLDPAHLPANTLVQVAKLARPEAMIEIEAIAVIP